jgi:hypothetical protein
VFGAIATATAGLRRADAWMTAAAGDIAAAGLPLAAPAPGASSAPASPPASAGGPSPDLTVAVPNLLVATDSARLNLAVIARAQDAYESVIDMARHA